MSIARKLLSPLGPARRGWAGYAVAAVMVLIGAANVFAMQSAAPVASLMLAIIVSAWFGGTRPGIFATVLSIPPLLYFLSAQSASLGVNQLPRVAYFLIIAAFIIWVIASLRRNEGQLREVIDSIPAMAWILQPDGRMEFLNRRWLEYAGMSLPEALTGSISILHPDDHAKVVEKWHEMHAAGEAYDAEMRLRRADGEYRWFLVRTVPKRDEDGAIVRWYGTSTDIEDRKRAEQALQDSADRLQQLSRRLLEVQEGERRHLARELHDEFAQLLTAIDLRLHAARDAAGGAARQNLDQGIELLERVATRVRNLALELRPVMLESAGLDSALRWLAEQHLEQTGVPVRISGHVREAPADVAIACFRVAQEALTNVMKHAKAKSVGIDLRDDGAAIEMVVQDDGVGFDVVRALGDAGGGVRLGLLGIKERVETLNGTMRVYSQPGEGTQVRVSLPRRA